MERAEIEGVTLEYEKRRSGVPVVLIHGGFIADTYAPLMTEPALAGFTLIRYHRRGYAGSSRLKAPLSISGQAADCLALLRHLSVHQAHVVGHSYGGVIPSSLLSTRPVQSVPSPCWSRHCWPFPAAQSSQKRSRWPL
jgi:pimeloyl-ACP methyl ester carboxylesterase